MINYDNTTSLPSICLANNCINPDTQKAYTLGEKCVSDVFNKVIHIVNKGGLKQIKLENMTFCRLAWTALRLNVNLQSMKSLN